MRERTRSLLLAVAVLAAVLALPTAAGAQASSATACPATFEVLHDDTVGALYLVKGVGAGQAGVMAAILGIFLPALVYTLLGGLWVLRSLVEITGTARR